MNIITSKSNESIKLYRKLSSSKKERSLQRLFTLEGLRLVSDAVGESVRFHCIFITEEALKRYGDTVSAAVDAAGSRAYIITDEIAASISETESSQGIFAVCHMPDEASPADIIKSGGRYIMPVQLQDPGNMGTLIRTADAMGIDGIICCGCCDIFNPKTVRSAMGSLFKIPISVCDEDAAFAAFEAAGIPTFAAVVDSSALSVEKCDFSHGAAALIGNEGNGLSDDIARRCTHRVTIHMKGRANSLNAAMAAGIIMWELSK